MSRSRSRYRAWSNYRSRYRSRSWHAFPCLVQVHVFPYHALPWNVPNMLFFESVRGRERKTKSERVREWESEWVNERVSEWESEWVSEWESEWVREWESEWESEWMREWVREWVNERVNERVCVYIYNASGHTDTKCTECTTKKPNRSRWKNQYSHSLTHSLTL